MTRSTSHPRDSQSSPPSPAGSLRVRLFISALLLLHVTALLVGPWASPPPSSQLARAFESVLDPYLNAVFLKGHGYRFFAPDPGPSHMVRYELALPDGTTETRQFPDVSRHWPRLLYHRNFMLSETVYRWAAAADVANSDSAVLKRRIDGLAAAATKLRAAGDNEAAAVLDRESQILRERLPETWSAEDRQAYNRIRQELHALLEPLANHLLREHGAVGVKLYSVEHLIPTPEQVLEGMELTDQSLYVEELLGEYFAQEEEIVEPAGEPL